jgi:HK97 family phage major capsid protein
MTVQEMQAQHDTAMSSAESLISNAERQKRKLTPNEQQTIDTNLRTAGDLKARISVAKASSASVRPRSTAEMRALIDAHPREQSTRRANEIMPNKFSWDYHRGFYGGYLGRSGPLNASLQEGTSSAGGYAVPIVVDGNVVPLAPQDSAIRRLATVIPTTSDIKVAGVTTRGTVAAKSETSSFTTAVPSLGQFDLSAFPAGVEIPVSIELAQDVNVVPNILLPDATSAFLEYEESLFISGSGSGQPQGLIGNVGPGLTREPDSLGNVVSVQATWDMLGTLKATYDKNARWLMQKATAIGIRKAQVQSGFYEPVFRRENGIDLLHGYEVAYSTQMPTAARSNTPLLFGDFARGYLIGDRGGPALILKVLDQAGAAQGLIDLLFYRRTDGRVRVAEAIQSLTIAAS